jgi:hypothetical protein
VQLLVARPDIETLKEEAAQLQRVSAQLAAASPSDGALELNQFARQAVVTNE